MMQNMFAGVGDRRARLAAVSAKEMFRSLMTEAMAKQMTKAWRRRRGRHRPA
jgi:hypothetical protein